MEKKFLIILILTNLFLLTIGLSNYLPRKEFLPLKEKFQKFSTSRVLAAGTSFDNEDDGIIILKFQIGNRVMLVNDTQLEMDVAPTIIEGRTLLPIRYVAEPLGAIVGWDGYERKVTVSLDDIFIELWIGKSSARVNGEYKFIDPDNPKIVPLILNGRTMLPVRFVAENLGCRVEWSGVTRTVTIIYETSNPRPDLIVENISWSPSSPKEGDSVTIKAKIKNIGDATAYGFDTTLYIGGSSYSTKYTSSLSPNSSTIITFSSWTVTSGCKNIKVFVDSEYNVKELIEDNNDVIDEICPEEIPITKAINYLNPISYEADYILSFSYAEDIVINKFDLYVPIPKEWDSQREMVVDRIIPLGGEVKEDNLGNSYWYFDKNAISNNKLTVKQKFQFTSYEVQTDLNLAKLLETPYDRNSLLYKLYTRSSSTIQANSREIRSFTNELVSNLEDPIDKCKKIYYYIVRNISYSNEHRDALETFKRRNGDCGSHTALFCAMARSIGIPARPIVGYWTDEKDGFYHVWAEFYVAGVGWIPVDPTIGVDYPSVREYYFGNMDNKRFIMSKGFDLEIDNYNIVLSQRFAFWWWGHWIYDPPSVNVNFSLKFRRKN